MADTFSMEFGGMDAFSATHHAAGEAHSAAGSGELGAMLASSAAALGPVGAHFHAAFASALGNVMTANKALSDLYHGLGHATTAAKVTAIASDNA